MSYLSLAPLPSVVIQKMSFEKVKMLYHLKQTALQEGGIEVGVCKNPDVHVDLHEDGEKLRFLLAL